MRKGLNPQAGAGWLPADFIITTQGTTMRKDIHPEYMTTKVTCACGNTFEVRSNKPELSIDICNECHPFFTGSEKIVDAAGRVDKFKKKYNLD
jgi:large subunit ribosomal protein L31